mgnify:CR=1 FL=1
MTATLTLSLKESSDWSKALTIWALLRASHTSWLLFREESARDGQLTQKQLSERRGKDMGEDVFQTGKSADGTLGLGAEVNIMGDIINLVDFYTENNIAEENKSHAVHYRVGNEV